MANDSRGPKRCGGPVSRSRRALVAEQQRIVGILDGAFAGIATAKANAEKNLRNARALFLRERAGGLPPARLLPSPKR